MIEFNLYAFVLKNNVSKRGIRRNWPILNVAQQNLRANVLPKGKIFEAHSSKRPPSPLVFDILLANLANEKIRKKIKGIYSFWRQWNQNLIILDDMIIYLEDLRESNKTKKASKN